MAADATYGQGTGLQRRQDGTTAIPSGGSLDIESGGSLKLAGTAVTSTAAELNILDTVTSTAAELNYLDLTTGPGTQEASKAVVADANVNTGVSKVTELHIGASGSETQVTSTAAELNILDGVTATAAELNLTDDLPASFTLTPAQGGANVCEVTIQAKDAAGTNMARAVLIMVHLSDASTGIGLTATAASGTVTAKAASGTDFGAITAKKALFAQTKADGSFILEITDTAKTGFYVVASPLQGGAPDVSAQLTSGDYGA